MENYIVINGKKAELAPEQLKALGIEMGNPFERWDGQKYWYIDPDFTTVNYGNDTDSCLDNYRYQVANYCVDKEMMQQQAWKEELSRLLWRFSMEHNGDKIDFNKNTPKWTIKVVVKDNSWGRLYRSLYCPDNTCFSIDYEYSAHSIPGVYFASDEIATQAIKKVIEPFLEEHPDFVL